MYQKFGLFLNGAWCEASDKQSAPVFSPVTQESLGNVPYATHADTAEAIASAARAFEIWKRVFSVLVVLPTGAGKTILFSLIISDFAKRGIRAMVICERRELVWQTRKKIQEV